MMIWQLVICHALLSGTAFCADMTVENIPEEAVCFRKLKEAQDSGKTVFSFCRLVRK